MTSILLIHVFTLKSALDMMMLLAQDPIEKLSYPLKNLKQHI
jgi:hypothetical protein